MGRSAELILLSWSHSWANGLAHSSPLSEVSYSHLPATGMTPIAFPDPLRNELLLIWY
jgi:hypothetical protein